MSLFELGFDGLDLKPRPSKRPMGTQVTLTTYGLSRIFLTTITSKCFFSHLFEVVSLLSKANVVTFNVRVEDTD